MRLKGYARVTFFLSNHPSDQQINNTADNHDRNQEVAENDHQNNNCNRNYCANYSTRRGGVWGSGRVGHRPVFVYLAFLFTELLEIKIVEVWHGHFGGPFLCGKDIELIPISQ